MTSSVPMYFPGEREEHAKRRAAVAWMAARNVHRQVFHVSEVIADPTTGAPVLVWRIKTPVACLADKGVRFTPDEDARWKRWCDLRERLMNEAWHVGVHGVPAAEALVEEQRQRDRHRREAATMRAASGTLRGRGAA